MIMAFQWERKPIAQSPLSIVVTSNEIAPEALGVTLRELDEQARRHGQPYEIIVPIEPGREPALQSILHQSPHAKLVPDASVSRGIGAALRIGIAAAQHPLLFTIPVGYQPQLLPDFLREIDLVDIVCGARKGTANRWQWRQFFSASYQIFGIWLQDPECPVRLYRRALFARVPIQSNGAFAQIEILAKANFQSCLLTEVAIDGPATDAPKASGDFWRVLKNPNFGPPPEKAIEPATKPIISTKAPESFAHTAEDR